MSTIAVTTADELWNMPRATGRYELVRGELRAMSPAGGEHGFVVIRVTTPLDQFVTARALGVVLGAETGFRIGTNPDTVRAPDVAFVANDHIPPGGIPTSFWPGAPDLAVEVRSPSDSDLDVAEKVADWLTAGTTMVWVVDPKRRIVAVYRSASLVSVVSEHDEIEGGAVLPGFRCRVGDWFPR